MVLQYENRIKTASIYFFLILFAVIFVAPYIWMLSASFKYQKDIFVLSIIPKDVITGEYYFTFDNYFRAFKKLNMLLLFSNTILIAIVNTLCNLFFNSMAAYSFARLNFPGRDKIFKLLLTSLMIPFTVLLIPNVYIVKMLGMYNSRLALIFPLLMSVYNVFLLRQTFLNSIKEIEESARIDGCSYFRIYWQIILPLHLPILVTTGIFTFLFNYNNFFWPMIVINNTKLFTLPLGLASVLTHNRGMNYDILTASSVVTSIPLIALFLIFQRYIMDGIAVGSVKG